MSIVEIITPNRFSFKHTVRSHGWYDLLPFVFDEVNESLSFVSCGGSKPVFVTISGTDGGLSVDVNAKKFDRDAVERDVRRLLRLDDHMEEFYASAEKAGHVLWAAEANAGRLLRSPTVWEDLVKSICTTNCTWAVTRNMTTKLVEELGEPTRCGRKAFPTAEAMATRDAAFYRETVRAGYRSEYFAELAVSVAEGRVDPESWLTSDLPTAELKKEMKKVKGVGDYAAENLLKLVGRYDGLALDSWLRAGFYKKHNKGKKCDDKKIARHYQKFRSWQGLAIWCDMTEDWFTEKMSEPPA